MPIIGRYLKGKHLRHKWKNTVSGYKDNFSGLQNSKEACNLNLRLDQWRTYDIPCFMPLSGIRQHNIHSLTNVKRAENCISTVLTRMQQTTYRLPA
jgi:hypothetical protein